MSFIARWVFSRPAKSKPKSTSKGPVKGSTHTYSPFPSRSNTGYAPSPAPSFSHGRDVYPFSQDISGKFVKRRKLNRLLHDRFGDDYELEMQSNHYRVYTRKRLTEEEILSCC
ncbi:hypothetical protein Cob_v012523 [Colletotrichum orbiculare MAFF 240422]|uniref:Uncharacterized protein n=1 Tax=Colletotrichum orbiculare (strain 104-T / ATCC 96160 / CBS 514.97 / LARS 414 / MAFF 240422) TaxID=1213857 RepID=A0A484FCA1_COLOR|nr:hypothetical protein Cob_v012523 [Colletotrichum orbiculare MAFF 240422]